MSLRCETPSEAFVYATEVFYPGWRAYVDGHRTEIVRANMTFRTIRIPPGEHIISFRYVPMSFYAGLVLTIIGFITSGLILIISKRG